MAISFESFMREISKIASGTSGSMKNISKEKFLALPIIYPPSQQQNQFAERIQLIEAQNEQAQRSLEKSEALFNSLLQQAFSGELSVKKEQLLNDKMDLYQILLTDGDLKIFKKSHNQITDRTTNRDRAIISYQMVVHLNRTIVYKKFKPKSIIEKFNKYAQEIISGKRLIISGGLTGVLYLTDGFASALSNVEDLTKSPSFFGAIGLLSLIVHSVDTLSKNVLDDIAYVAIVSVLYGKSFGTDLLHLNVLNYVRETCKGMKDYELTLDEFKNYLDKLQEYELIEKTDNGNWYISDVVTFETSEY